MGRNFSDAADSAIVVSAHPMCAELFYFETDANSVGVAEMLSKEDSPALRGCYHSVFLYYTE